MAHAIPSCLRLHTFKNYRQQNTKTYLLLGIIRERSPTRITFCLPSRHYASDIGGPTPGQIDLRGDGEERTQTGQKNTRSNWSPTLFKMFESSATTFASILVLGLAGYAYHRVRRSLGQDDSIPDYSSTWKP